MTLIVCKLQLLKFIVNDNIKVLRISKNIFILYIYSIVFYSWLFYHIKNIKYAYLTFKFKILHGEIMSKLFLCNHILNKTIVGMMAIIAVLSIGIIQVFDLITYVHAVGVSDSVSSSDANSGSAAYANKYNAGASSATGKTVDCFATGVDDMVGFSNCFGYSP